MLGQEGRGKNWCSFLSPLTSVVSDSVFKSVVTAGAFGFGRSRLGEYFHGTVRAFGMGEEVHVQEACGNEW